MKIYVGNLSEQVSDRSLAQAFEPFGRVASAETVKEHGSGATRGFGYVEMPDATEAQSAIDSLNGQELQGKRLMVQSSI